MAHAHQHGHAHGTSGDDRTSLKRAFVLNAAFTGIELVGGLLTGSVAILADAVHDLGDTGSIGFGLWTERRARQSEAAVRAGRDPGRATYGQRRLTLLSALINALILTAGSAAIIVETVRRFGEAATPHAGGMIALACLGVIVNGAAAWSARGGRSANAEIISWHLLEDVLGWAAVLVGGILLALTGWTWIDPLLALGIAGFILVNVLRRLGGLVRLFLQYAPEHRDPQALRDRLLDDPAIASLHHLHVWSLDGEADVLTLHAVLPAGADLDTYHAAKQAIRDLQTAEGFAHITAEVEFAEEPCALRPQEG
ncbi:MAG: cation diffusion facilitator family transporter [Opitutales bacterium]